MNKKRYLTIPVLEIAARKSHCSHCVRRGGSDYCSLFEEGLTVDSGLRELRCNACIIAEFNTETIKDAEVTG